MPEGFAMPAPGVQLWMPWNLTGDLPRDQHCLGAVARVKPQVTRGRSTVVGWVARAGLRLIIVGIGAGLAGTWACAGTLEGCFSALPRPTRSRRSSSCWR